MNTTAWRKALVVLLAGMVAAMYLVPASSTSAAPAIPAPAEVLKTGATGYSVTQVQYMLKSFGYSVKVTGVYDQRTVKAVLHWQKANRLVRDGIVGSQTWISLMSRAPTVLMTAPAVVKKARAPAPAVVPVNEPAVADEPATPVEPRTDTQYAPDGLSGCEEMNWYRVNAGLPERFDDSGHHQRWVRSDGVGWRESKCDNTALSPNGCCGGYWQNYISSHLSGGSQYRERVINECGVTRMSDIRGESPQQKWASACVTAVVYSISGESPWG